MKINIDVDITPEEARRFLGQPDLEPMQQRVLEEMERRLIENMDRFSPDQVLNRWMSFGAGVPETLFNMVGIGARDAEAKKQPGKKAPPAKS